MSNGWGGKRAGAGRKPKARNQGEIKPAADPAPPFDALAVLRQVAADESSPATARVAAARALVAYQAEVEREAARSRRREFGIGDDPGEDLDGELDHASRRAARMMERTHGKH